MELMDLARDINKASSVVAKGTKLRLRPEIMQGEGVQGQC